MVAGDVIRPGDDFVPKYRHTVVVFALVLSTALTLYTGGLRGTVMIDPAQPVCRVAESCSAPDRYDVLAFKRNGKRIAQTRTDGAGRYHIALSPGTYIVVAPRRQGIGRGLQPSRVVVPRSRYARVNFTLDIGIR